MSTLFSIFENLGFKKFIRNLQPKFNIMSRKTVKGGYIGLYEREKKLYDFFESFSGRISITTEMWTSNQTLGYL